MEETRHKIESILANFLRDVKDNVLHNVPHYKRALSSLRVEIADNDSAEAIALRSKHELALFLVNQVGDSKTDESTQLRSTTKKLKHARRFVELLYEKPMLRQSEMARNLRLRKQIIYRMAQRLKEQKVITESKLGDAVFYSLTPKARFSFRNEVIPPWTTKAYITLTRILEDAEKASTKQRTAASLCQKHGFGKLEALESVQTMLSALCMANVIKGIESKGKNNFLFFFAGRRQPNVQININSTTIQVTTRILLLVDEKKPFGLLKNQKHFHSELYTFHRRSDKIFAKIELYESHRVFLKRIGFDSITVDFSEPRKLPMVKKDSEVSE